MEGFAAHYEMTFRLPALLHLNHLRTKAKAMVGFVHGDIRSINTLIRKPDVAPNLPELLIVS